MIEQIIGDKKYTLSKIDYNFANGVPSLYIEVSVIKDIEFGVVDYIYGMGFNEEEILVYEQNISSMTEYVVQKLLDEQA